MEPAFDPTSLKAAGSTSLVVIWLAASFVELLVGIAIGWWLRSGKTAAPPGSSSAGEPSGADRQSQDNLREAQHALSNLRELAQRVQADVGAHSSQVEAISNQLSAQQKQGSTNEIDVIATVAKILEANERLETQLHSAESKLKQQAEQIEFHAANALTDALTGLGNRRAFDAELARRSAEFQRYNKPYCLLMLDVDHFKKFNDTHGHRAGDEVLRLVSQKLKAAVRTPDFVARYGGEEFSVIMPQTTLDQTPICGGRIRAAIEQAICQFEGKELRVTVSIGIAQATAGQSSASLVQCADEALYAAKQAGRNQVKLYGGPNTPKANHPVESSERSLAPPPQELTTPVAAIPPAKMPSVDTLSAALPAEYKPSAHDSHESIAGDLRTDHQTGLPNRTAFCEDIRRRLSESQRHDSRLSLMLVKVDNLQQVIGRHGAAAGDMILRTCTQFLSAAMRDMDMVARYKSDIFGIVLPGTVLSRVMDAAERLRCAVEQCPLKLGSEEVRFTISVGVAEAQSGEDLVSFITRTESAQAKAVATGGNRICFHNGAAVEAMPVQEPAIVS